MVIIWEVSRVPVTVIPHREGVIIRITMVDMMVTHHHHIHNKVILDHSGVDALDGNEMFLSYTICKFKGLSIKDVDTFSFNFNKPLVYLITSSSSSAFICLGL